MGTCTSCRQPITWAVFQVSGKACPLDPNPIEGGNLLVVDVAEGGTLVVGHENSLLAIPAPGYEGQRYQSHFASCPNARQHRSK